MVGKTNVAGIRLRSVIAVSYPAGSVCTCSNGIKTLKARDTGGKALFNVSTGTWTVSCTDGSRTKSANVSITAEGQNVSVTLTYQFWLFRNTDSYVDPSVGGWSSDGYRQGTSSPSGGGGISPGMLYCVGSKDNYEGCNGTVNAVNLTPYKTLKASVTCTDSNNSFFLVVSAKNPFDQHIVAKQDLAAVSQEVSISLDGINGNYYIVFTSPSQTNGQTKVWNAYLE